MRRVRFLILSLLALTVLSTGAQAPPSLPDRNDVNHHMAFGRYEEALEAAEKRLQADPESIENNLDRIACLLKLLRYSDATEAAEELLRRHPDRQEVRDLAGSCFFLTFRPKEAVAAWEPLLSDERWRPKVYIKTLLAMLGAGERGRAESLLRTTAPVDESTGEEILLIYLQVFLNGPGRLPPLKELARRHPENEQYQQELDLQVALGNRSIATRSGVGESPFRAKAREIRGEPSIQVRFNGNKKAWLALDTGSGTLLNRDTVKKMKPEILGTMHHQGWGYKGAQETSVALLESMDIGGMVFSNVPIRVNNRDAEFWTDKAGYLGIQFLRDFVIHYDRRKGFLELWPPGTPAEDLLGEEGVTLPILWSRDLPLVPLRINGHDEYPVLMDTGAPDSFLDKKRTERLGVKMNSGKYRNTRAWGMSGAFTLHIAEQVVLDFAGENYPLRRVYVSDVPQSFSVPVYGILGRDILNRFRMVIDGPNSKLVLVPYPY